MTIPADQQHILDSYRAWLRTWASERTADSRMTMATARVKEWGVEGITEANVIEFLGRPAPSGKPRSKWTRSTYHGHLSCFSRWLLLAGHIAVDPMENVRKPKRPQQKPRPLSEREVERVLSVVQPPVSDWITLALLTGLRASEIAKVRGEDVTDHGLYVSGKGDKDEVLPVHADILAMADRYPSSGYWFPGADHGHIRGQHISLTVGKLFDSLGIEGSIHRCRHVYGTRLMRAGVNIRTVQKLMRHASLDTTAAYTAVDESELQAAVNLLGTTSRVAS